jgi:hypothetical protein
VSTVVVSNIHFESTGNNRIQIEGSNTSIYQAGQLMMTANSTEMTLFGNGQAYSVIGSLYRTGDIVIQPENSTPPEGFVETDIILSKSSYPDLYSLVGDVNYVFPFWKIRTTPTSFTRNGVTYGNGVFVTVGAASSPIQTSTDGVTWTNRTSANANLQYAVTYGNGIFVSVGASGSIQTSTNGTTWTNRTSANTLSNFAIVYGNDIFVSVGGAGSIQTSTNGTTWTNRTTANTNTQNGVTYGNGIFVSVGASGSIQTSTNGITWTNRTTANTNTQRSVAYGNGVYVSMGELGSIQISTDAVTWNNITRFTRRNNSGLRYLNGIFIAVNALDVATSTNGINWKVNKNIGVGRDFTYADGLYVAVGSEIRTTATNEEFVAPFNNSIINNFITEDVFVIDTEYFAQNMSTKAYIKV